MNIQIRCRMTRVAVSALLGLAVAFLSAPAFAALGDVLRTAFLPEGVECVSGLNRVRTSVAVVQGSKVGFTDKPVVLITSCFVESGDNSANGNRLRTSLFVLDPGSPFEGTISNATLLKTITTTVAPQNGWGSLEYRPDKGDLLGCASRSGNPHQIYAIDISVLNTVPDGTATFLFDAAQGTSPCDGVAWDASDDSVFMSPDVSSTIYHYQQVNGLWTQIGSFMTPSLVSNPQQRCRNSGLAVMGGTLFIGCNGDNDLFQLNKTSGAVIRSFVPAADVRNEDLACDPVTFASQNKDALWSTNGQQGSNTLFAFEIPAGTCGLPTGPTVLNPGACRLTTDSDGDGIKDLDPIQVDSDGDGLLDCWEDGTKWPDGLPGIDFDGDGTRDLVLCVETNGIPGFQPEECADKSAKDIFVEFDAMAQHSPDIAELNLVVTAFSSAPVDAPNGISLHIQVDDLNIPHVNDTAMPPCTPLPGVGHANFDDLKAAWFGTAAERPAAGDSVATLAQKEKARFAKRMAFHYGIGVHNLTRPAGKTSPSGCAEVGSNDFMVASGSFGVSPPTHKNGNLAGFWSGTFMHELGHNLSLRHGGGDNTNCKPNYRSVMSYPSQTKAVFNRPLDYSRETLPTLNEVTLVEQLGIGFGAPVGAQTVVGPTTARVVDGAGGPINFDGDALPAELGALSVNINKIGNVGGCDGAGGGLNAAGVADGTTLVGYNDWANLQYNFRASFDFSDGVHSTADEVQEIDEEQLTELFQLADANGDGIGDAQACGGAACLIDVVPGLASNKVLLFNHNGVPTAIVPVAVLSTVAFDATRVNPATLTLDGTPVAVKFGKRLCAALNVGGSSARDLACTFVLTGLSPGPTTVILEGKTFTGEAIRAQDAMQVVEFNH